MLRIIFDCVIMRSLNQQTGAKKMNHYNDDDVKIDVDEREDEVVACNRSIYIAIGHLVQDLRAAHAAGIRAMKLANKLDKKWRARVFPQMNRISAELKRYEAQIQDGFTVITYSGCIVGKYNDSK